MWIVEYFSNHLQKNIKCYYARQATAEEAYRRKKYDQKDVTIGYDNTFKIEEWEK